MRAISNVRYQHAGFPGATEIAREGSGMEFVESHYTQPTLMEMHAHPFPFFHVILTGHLQSRSSDRQGSGDTLQVAYFPAGVPHETLWQGCGKGFSVAFDPGKATEWQNWGMLPDHPMTIDPGLLSALLLTVRRECFVTDQASVIKAENYLAEAMGELMRLPERIVAERISSRLRKVREIISDTYDTLPTLSELAHQVEVHPVYLARAFRRAFGETIGDCIRRRRIDAAARLISRTDHALSEVAHEVGFADQAHFSRTFKQYIGIPPVEYLQMTRHPKNRL